MLVNCWEILSFIWLLFLLLTPFTCLLFLSEAVREWKTAGKRQGYLFKLCLFWGLQLFFDVECFPELVASPRQGIEIYQLIFGKFEVCVSSNCIQHRLLLAGESTCCRHVLFPPAAAAERKYFHPVRSDNSLLRKNFSLASGSSSF